MIIPPVIFQQVTHTPRHTELWPSGHMAPLQDPGNRFPSPLLSSISCEEETVLCCFQKYLRLSHSPLRIYSVTKNSSILTQSKAKQAQTAKRTATIPLPTTTMRYTRVGIPWNPFHVFGRNLLVFKLPHKVNRTLKIKADWNHKAFVTTENQNTGGRLLLGQCFGGWKFQNESHVTPTISPQKVLHLFRSPAELKWSPLDHSCVKSLPKLIRKEGIPASQEVPKGMGEHCGFLFPTSWGGRVMHSRHLRGGRESVPSVSLQSWCRRNLARVLGRLTGTSLGVQRSDPTLPQQGEGIRSLVRELRSQWPHGVAKKKGLGGLWCVMHLPHPWIYVDVGGSVPADDAFKRHVLECYFTEGGNTTFSAHLSWFSCVSFVSKQVSPLAYGFLTFNTLIWPIPVWTPWCQVRLELWLKNFSHWSHLGLSPLWTLTVTEASPKGFSTFTAFTGPLSCVNPLVFQEVGSLTKQFPHMFLQYSFPI